MAASAVKLTCDLGDDVAYPSFGGQRSGPVKTVVCGIGDAPELVGIDIDEVANRVLGIDFRPPRPFPVSVALRAVA